MAQATATRMDQTTNTTTGQKDAAESMIRTVDESTKQATGISLFHILTLGSIGASNALFYGLTNNQQGPAQESFWLQLAGAFFWGYAFIHYYLDSKIWRVRRDPSVGQALKL